MLARATPSRPAITDRRSRRRQEQQPGAQDADQRVQADLNGGADRRGLAEGEELEQVGERRTKTVCRSMGL